jgi:hypothetical protein
MGATMRFLFALLLGFILGAATILYLMHSGAGDFVIRATAPVQDLERRLREVELQRDALGRRLDEVVSRAGRMEAAFAEVERRFRALQERAAPPAGEAPVPDASAPRPGDPQGD